MLLLSCLVAITHRKTFYYYLLVYRLRNQKYINVNNYKHEARTFKLKSSTHDPNCTLIEHLPYDMCFIWNIANPYKQPFRMNILGLCYYFSRAQKWDLKPGLSDACLFIFPILLWTQSCLLPLDFPGGIHIVFRTGFGIWKRLIYFFQTQLLFIKPFHLVKPAQIIFHTDPKN